MRGDKAAVRALLAQKADVNAPQSDGATALHWAVYRGDKELADMLMRAGANVEGGEPRGLDAAVARQRQRRRRDHRGAARRPAPIANEKLPLGRTPLMMAARTGNVEAMKVLLDRGADVNAKETLRGTTPLMWAADEGHAGGGASS